MEPSKSSQGSPPDQPAPAPDPARKTILIVDDTQAIREMLTIGLTQHGLAVLCAADGHQACEIFRQHHDTISVVLMDIEMPHLSGPQTLQRLRAIAPVRCFLMTAGSAHSKEDLLTEGVLGVIEKPFCSFPELVRTLNEAAGSDGIEEHGAHALPPPQSPQLKASKTAGT